MPATATAENAPDPTPSADWSPGCDWLVLRRRWLSDAAYADLAALCQLLPGPASSQVGFALGFLRGGLAGGLFAWALSCSPAPLVCRTR